MKPVNDKKGFALVFSMLILSLIISFMAVFILSVASGLSQTNRIANAQKAYYIADAGLADAYQRICKAGLNIIPSSTPGNPFIPSAQTDDGQYSIESTNGNYTVTILYSSNPRTTYTITSTGTYKNTSRTLQLKIIGAAISKYAYWSQTELNPAFGGPLWWVGEPGLEMLTTGPVQTNGQLNIFGNPIFNGPVSEANLPILANGSLGSTPTSSTPNYYPGKGSDPAIIFPNGLQNDAPPINLPAQQTLSAINNIIGTNQGLILTGSSTVIFNAAGTITVTGKNTDNTGAVISSYKNTTLAMPSNGIIYIKNSPGKTDGTVTVQGTVNGQLTVAAENNINISGNLSYNSDPRTNPQSTDMLGLIANKNINVIQASVPTRLELSAVMVALQGSFQVDQYWIYRGDAKTAVMDQFGSLVNYVDGPTGEMNWSGTLLAGWNQIQTYDTRLATLAPPGFPPYVNNQGNGVYTKIGFKEL